MAGPIPLLLYLVGPLVLAFVASRVLETSLAPFRAGLITFLLSWVCVILVTQAIAASSAWARHDTVLYTILVAAAAGLFEETGRFFAFRAFRALRAAPTWRTALVYAAGHGGMETLVVGASLGLTAAVVAHRPDLLTPEVLASSRAVLATGAGAAVYAAVERLLVGALIHSCFTLVVLLGILRRQRRYLGAAILWHFAHDVIAQNLERVAPHWPAHAAWILVLVVGYTWLAVRLLRSAAAPSQRFSASVRTAGATV